MTATLVELVDGRIVESCAEAWRLECFARHLLHLPLPERRAWLADHETRHGREDVERVKSVMTQIFEKERGNGQSQS